MDPAAGRRTSWCRRTARSLARRLFLARGVALTAGAVALGTAGTGAYIANSPPVVRRVPITLPTLDPALDGLRIVTFSDAHLSATYGGRRFERLVEIVNAQRPDVVAIVGDLVDGSVEELRRGRGPARRPGQRAGRLLRHRQPRVLRRHPRLAAAPPDPRCARAAQRAGPDPPGDGVVRPGRHRRPDGGGLGHARAGADLDAALDGRDDSTPVVLLAHQPVMVEQARAAGVDLQLSGHTQGGQLGPSTT